MEACQQFAGQNTYEHGISVRDHLFDLIDHLETGAELKHAWRLPSWFLEHQSQLLERLLPREMLSNYTTFHDCGKPRCLTTDVDGKRHFPNHAEISAQTWLEVGGDPNEAELMRLDMMMHTASAPEMEQLALRPEAASLLLTALAEIHSNAVMFGGISSTSFKIKWKKLDRNGKHLCRVMFSTR